MSVRSRFFVVAVFLFGCADADPGSDAGQDAACPELRGPLAMPGDAIDGDDYATLAQPFFETYCVRCHESVKTGAARNRAPLGLDWDQEASVRSHLPEIRDAVGVTNFMPFSAPFPSCEERARLVRWIDADAP
jgi:uncharacterized membrane protein